MVPAMDLESYGLSLGWPLGRFRSRPAVAAEACVKQRGRRPAVYSGAEDIWEKMVERDDIDVVYIATPWAWHVPMCLRTMERGKHAFVEVAAAMLPFGIDRFNMATKGL